MSFSSFSSFSSLFILKLSLTKIPKYYFHNENEDLYGDRGIEDREDKGQGTRRGQEDRRIGGQEDRTYPTQLVVENTLHRQSSLFFSLLFDFLFFPCWLLVQSSLVQSSLSLVEESLRKKGPFQKEGEHQEEDRGGQDR